MFNVCNYGNVDSVEKKKVTVLYKMHSCFQIGNFNTVLRKLADGDKNTETC